MPSNASMVVVPLQHFSDNEEEIYGNIYVAGVKDTSSSYYVTLVPANVETSARLVGAYDSIVYQTQGRTWAFGWLDPAETGSGLCGSLDEYLDPLQNDSAREEEIHSLGPEGIGGGKEGHCIRPGQYVISLWEEGTSSPLRTFTIDYVQIGDSAPDSTYGTPTTSLLVENTLYDPDHAGLADNIFHFDLTPGPFVDSAVLQIDTARASPLTKPFRNDTSPSGLDTDWFRFGAQHSTSTWNLGGVSSGDLALQARLFYDYAMQTDLRSGYYAIHPSHSGSPVLRVFQYEGKLVGDTSAMVQVGLETKRPDETEASVPDVIREVEVIVDDPEEPEDTAINHFAMPAGVVENSQSWRMAYQYLNGLAAEAGAYRTYSYRFNGGAWIAAPTGALDFDGFASAGSNAITLKVYNSSIDSTHFYLGNVATNDSVMYFTGPQYITVKTTHTYSANRPGMWAERDSFPDEWRSTLEPADDEYNRIWAAGDYVMDLRVRDTTASVLRGGHMQITVCIVSQSCLETLTLASVRRQGGNVLFGGGPVISWGTAEAPAAVRYYELTGRHDGRTAFRERSWLERVGGTETTGLEGGSVTWTPRQDETADARIVDFVVTPPAGQPYVFGLSLDPDLGPNPADDQSGYDPSSGLLYVFDGSEAAGFLMRREETDALVGVAQYGAHHSPPASRREMWTVQRRTGFHLVNGEQDVQFIISAAERAGTDTFRLVILRAANPAALRAAAASYIERP